MHQLLLFHYFQQQSYSLNVSVHIAIMTSIEWYWTSIVQKKSRAGGGGRVRYLFSFLSNEYTGRNKEGIHKKLVNTENNLGDF